MNIGVIGSGYVGLVSGACLGHLGHSMMCLDINQSRVARLQAGEVPIYEPGLEELMTELRQHQRMTFTCDWDQLKQFQPDLLLVAVGTPSGADGQADLSYLKSALRSAAPQLPLNGVIVIKSTVPVQTAAHMEQLLSAECHRPDLQIVNNPEFLREGVAIDDFMRPDRIVIGARSSQGFKILRAMYQPLLDRHPSAQYMEMSNESAELTKYAANSFLAVKIAFINEMARLCEQVGASIEQVRAGMGSDHRIGKAFLAPGPGYGGSCFPKDVDALLSSAKFHGLELQVAQSAQDSNQAMKGHVLQRFLTLRARAGYKDHSAFSTVTIWGVAFKADTDDIRESSALFIISQLLEQPSITQIRIYDPQAMEHGKQYFHAHPQSNKLYWAKDLSDSVQTSSSLIVLTEWKQFQQFPLTEVKNALGAHGFVYDTRLFLNRSLAQQIQLSLTMLGDQWV